MQKWTPERIRSLKAAGGLTYKTLGEALGLGPGGARALCTDEGHRRHRRPAAFTVFALERLERLIAMQQRNDP